MNSRMARGAGFLLILILLFGLAGGALGEVIGQNFKNLSFLKTYMLIGMIKPLVLDLKLMSLTFGISFNVNILSLIGMLFGFLIYKKM